MTDASLQAKACYLRGDLEGCSDRLKECLGWEGLREDLRLRMRVLSLNILRRLGREEEPAELGRLEREWERSSEAYIRNLLLNEREITERRSALESLPSHLTVRLTNRCQLQCVMCGVRPNAEWGFKTWDIPEDKLQEVDRLLPCLEDLQWQGGEVFILDKKVFGGLLRRAASFPRLGQSIITNGLLIDPEWADILVESRINIRYSIDGATRGVYEAIRRGARHEDLLASIRRMNAAMDRKGRRIPFSIHMVVMRSNLGQVAMMMDFAREHRFDTVALSPISGPASNPENIFQNGDPETWATLAEERAKAKEKAARSGICLEDSLPSPSGPGQGPKPEPCRPGRFFCLSPWKRLNLTEGGYFTPNWHCDGYMDSFLDKTLLEAWNCAKMRRLREGILKGELEGLCTPYCLSGALMDIWRDHVEWNWS
jgi:MoaA/NifB/PqqE/SkfB family radical SAM enzyme